MIVNEEKPKEPNRRTREQILGELKRESTGVLCLALMYAQGYKKFGFDVTKVWGSLDEQNKRLQEVYNKGYEDGQINRWGV